MAPLPAASTQPAGLSGSPKCNRVEAFARGVAAWGAQCCASSQEGGSLSCWHIRFSGWVFMCRNCVWIHEPRHSWHVSSGVNSGPFSLTWNSLKLCYWSHTAEELLREPDVLRYRAPKAPAHEEAAHTACGSPLCTVLGGTCWLPPLPSASIGAGCVPAGDLLAGLWCSEDSEREPSQPFFSGLSLQTLLDTDSVSSTLVSG